MKKFKRILSLFMIMTLILVTISVGLNTMAAGAQSQAVTSFSASEFRRPAPDITLDVTDVTRVGSSDDTSMASGTTIKKATPSGVPYITGAFASQAYDGETPQWPSIAFTSSVPVNIISIMITGASASPTQTSGSLSNTTSSGWEIRGGTATAGSIIKIAVTYIYTWNNPYTGVSVNDTYTTNGYSYVENVIFPAGVWTFTSAYSSLDSAADVPYVSRLLGRGVYGNIIGVEANSSNEYSSGYYDFATNSHVDNGNTSIPMKTMLIANPEHFGAYDHFLALGQGSYAGGDLNRAKATVYLDTSTQTLQSNNFRMHFFIHSSSRSSSSNRDLTYETIHVRDGDVGYSGGTGNVLGSSSVGALAALNPSGPVDGTVATGGGFINAGMQTGSTLYGTGSGGSYTLITQWTGKGNQPGTGTPNWMEFYHAVTVEIVRVTKATLRAALNNSMGVATKSISGSSGVTTIMTANGTDPANGGISNTGKGKNPQGWYYSSGWNIFNISYDDAWGTLNKPNANQTLINTTVNNLNSANTGLALAGANYTNRTSQYLTTGLGNTFYNSTVNPLSTIVAAVQTADTSFSPNLALWQPGQYSCYTDESRAALEEAYAAAVDCLATNYNVLYQPYVDYCSQLLQSAVENLTLKTVTITFNTSGGNPTDSLTGNAGDPVNAPADPVREGYTFAGWNPALPATYPAEDLYVEAQWEEILPMTYEITFDANGGTGGTGPTVMQIGDPLTAPTVTRPGYAFAGWNPAVPSTVEGDETYTAQWVTTSVNVTQVDENNLAVNIQGWTADSQYQIWSYQQVTSDLLLDGTSNVAADQWILSMSYALGSEGVPQGDGSINFTIPYFVSSTYNYLIAVRIADSGGNIIQELRDAYTPEDVEEVVITKILVDSAVTTGYELREIKGGAQVEIQVVGNNVPDTVFTATMTAGPTPMPLPMTGNALTWEISALDAGLYTIEFTATNGTSTATETVDFELFSSTASTDYGVIDEMVLAPGAGVVDITPSFDNGTFSYRVREPGRTPTYRSVEYSEAGTIQHTITAPGIYHVYGYVTRAGLIGTEQGGYDDGMIRTLVVPRQGGGAVDMTFTANQTLPDVEKGTQIIFTANATGLPDTVEYSFWRHDATGYVLVKDWSTSPTLTWTPARIGEYTLEARAKGDGAGSYEVTKSLLVNVTAAGEEKAAVTGITINAAYLNTNAQAKQPIMITANATSTNGDDLLYKFNVYDDDMRTTQLKGYTIDQNCVWTPREAGIYTISVLVKNQVSFGKYDAIETFEIIVDFDTSLPLTTNIIFNTNGGTPVVAMSGEVGTPVQMPADPVKEGYTFAGWNPALPATFPAEDLNVEAQWIPIEYQITFDANGGTGGTGPIALQPGTSLTAPAVSREGYTFAGWLPEVPLAVPSSDTTYTAQWSVNSYLVTFDANGGEGGTSGYMEFGAELTAPAVERENYTFLGWEPAVPATVQAADSTYSAVWIINQYSITFNSAGGTAVEPITDDYGTPITAPPDPTREGYTFAGWVPAVPAAMPDSNMECIAQWTVNSYNLTFDANGGIGGTGPTSTEYGSVLSAPTVTTAGYTFAGWDPAVAATMPAADTTYTAQWTLDSYTITWDANGGTGGGSNSCEYGTAPEPIDAGTKEGYTFAGWAPEIVAATGEATYTAQWTLNNYTITWDANGGTGGGDNACDHFAIPEPIDAGTKEGYTFAGWTPEIAAATGPATYTAQWSANEYTIFFDEAGGSIVADIMQDYGTPITAPDIPTREGYVFTGWSPTLPEFMPGEDMVCVAQWTIGGYSINFDSAGGTPVDSITQSCGTAITAPSDPTREGYTFVGWAPAVPAVMPAYSVTCVAQWIINQYTVSFESAGGSAVESITQDYATDITAPADPTRTGYTFAGWTPAIPATMPAEDVECVAQWIINQYTVSFDSAGGSAVDSITQDYATEITSPADPTRTGYTFAGWLPAVPATMPAENIECVAQWTIGGYSINFDSAGGTPVDSITQSCGTAITAPSDPTREGYTFVGWAPAVPAVMPAYSVTCVAQWTINQYTVSFDSAGGTAVDPIMQDYNTTITAPADPTREGYTFAGWNPALPAVFPAEDLTVTAQWSVNSHTLTFNANNGTPVAPITTIPGAIVQKPMDPTRNSFSFDGWFYDISFTQPVVWPLTMPANSFTIYAKWVFGQYTITFNPNGGTAVSPITVNPGSWVFSPNIPEKTGYSFNGWYYDNDTFLDPVEWPVQVTVNSLTLYAKWTLQTATLTFNSLGGTNVDPITGEVGTPVQAPVDPTREGYTFAGWDPALPAVFPAEDLTVTAQWQLTLAAPEGLTAPSKTSTTVSLTWSAAANAEAYNIYCNGQKITYTPIVPLTYTAEGLTPQNQYSFTVTSVRAGEESAQSTVCVVTTDALVLPQVTISVGSTMGMPGQIVSVPVTVSPNADISAASYVMTFNKDVLDYIGYEIGAASPGSFVMNTNNAHIGVITAAYMNLDPDVYSGTIFTLQFMVKAGVQYQTSLLNFEVLELKNADYIDLPYSVEQGNISIGMPGDVNMNGIVTPVDALMALKASAEVITLNQNQFFAADVNKNGSVTSMDALMILKYSSGELTAF